MTNKTFTITLHPLQLSSTMASMNSSISLNGAKACEQECREIRAMMDRLNILGKALAHRTPVERRQIKESYEVLFKENLVERLHKMYLADNSNETIRVLYMWMLEAHERDAVTVHEATSDGRELDYNALIEMHTQRKSSQIFMTKQYYLSRFNRHLEQDSVTHEQSHPYQKILVALGTSHRSHHTETSQHIAKCDAKRLHEARKGTAGLIHEATILEMLSKRSIAQLKMALTSYKHIYGRDYTKVLKNRGGEFEGCLRVVLKCMHDPFKYYSKMLYTSLKKVSSSSRKSANGVVSRLMMNSVQVGIQEIKTVFHRKYNTSLDEFISERIQDGDYKDFLLALTRESSKEAAA